MKIGLWNIDHPEKDSGSKRKQKRFDKISNYLASASCDVYIITEANAALRLDEYKRVFSTESPFKSSNRFYGSPNVYHQVAIYSKASFVRAEVIDPLNSLYVRLESEDSLLNIFGNVVTLKDQWSKTSDLKYSDRLDQQLRSIKSLPRMRTLIAGDFNLRLGWPQKKRAYEKLVETASIEKLSWPTKKRKDTVQHVLHTNDLDVDLRFDFSIKCGGEEGNDLSDHPYIEISTTFK